MLSPADTLGIGSDCPLWEEKSWKEKEEKEGNEEEGGDKESIWQTNIILCTQHNRLARFYHSTEANTALYFDLCMTSSLTEHNDEQEEEILRFTDEEA